METSSFSFLTYKELRELQKRNDSFLLDAEVAYKQEKYSRSIHSLRKLREKNPKLTDQYIFFRSLGHEDVNEIVKCNIDDPLINTCIDYLKFYLKEPTREEVISKNFYLYLLLYYFPEIETIDLAYGHPEGKYGEAFYIYCLYRKVFLIKDIRKYVNDIKKNDKGVPSFINLHQRETLDLLSRSLYLKEDQYLSFNGLGNKYKELRDLNIKERKDILQSLGNLECISVKDGRIELLPGGFFLLGCFNALD